MTNHFNELTEAEQERLAVLIEECGEVVQVACKVLRHGYGSHHPSDPDGMTNRQLLARESGDLIHAINMLTSAGDVNGGSIALHAADKKMRIWRYLHHQGRMGATCQPEDRRRA